MFSLALAVFVSPLASSFPDGLERVAEDHGFLGKGEIEPLWKWAPIRDYELAVFSRPFLASGAAGFIGTLLVFGVALCLFKFLVRRDV